MLRNVVIYIKTNTCWLNIHGKPISLLCQLIFQIKVGRENLKIERPLLMIPGPTICTPEVLRALSKPTLSHVSPEFIEIFS